VGLAKHILNKYGRFYAGFASRVLVSGVNLYIIRQQGTSNRNGNYLVRQSRNLITCHSPIILDMTLITLVCYRPYDGAVLYIRLVRSTVDSPTYAGHA